MEDLRPDPDGPVNAADEALPAGASEVDEMHETHEVDAAAGPDGAVDDAVPVEVTAAVDEADPLEDAAPVEDGAPVDDAAPVEVTAADEAGPVDETGPVDDSAQDELTAPDDDGAPVDVAGPDEVIAPPVLLLHDAPVTPTPVLRPVTRRRSRLRRAVAVGVPTLVVALAVSAFATVGPSSGNVDQRFVDAARAQGHAVDAGQQEELLVSAARKICDRKQSHSTIAERKASALSSAELGAVTTTFDEDARGFTELALKTYCTD